MAKLMSAFIRNAMSPTKGSSVRMLRWTSVQTGRLRTKIMAEKSIMSYWINFFVDAGIPPSDATNYAVTFTDHRMQKGMLLDLTKEYLNDMGITLLGDVISILKHAKTVHTQDAREKALRETGGSPVSVTSRRSTAASRIIDHYLGTGSDPNAAPMNHPSPKVSMDLSSNRQEQIVRESKYSKKSSVFERLGETASSPQVTLTESGNVFVRSLTSCTKVSSSSSTPSSVFSRLGDKSSLKRAAASPLDGEVKRKIGPPLEYAGVLKASPKKQKKTAVTMVLASHDTPEITISNEGLGEPPVSTEGILSPDAKQEPLSVKQRLGKKVITAPATSTTEIVPVTVKKSIRERLGVQKPVDTGCPDNELAPSINNTQEPIPNVCGVFSRLGKHNTNS